MKLGNMTDESLLAYYESVRRQVAADSQLGDRYRLAGGTVKEYAERLKDEIGDGKSGSRRSTGHWPDHLT